MRPRTRAARQVKPPRGTSRDVVFLVVLGSSLAVATWQRSGDPFIDWGRELYSAMSVARGLGIPEDVQLLFGSLSPLVNGAVLRIAGEYTSTILLLNLSILAVTCALAWRIAAMLFGRSAAFMATIVWMLLTAYPHLVRVGNYNFLTPYSHGITHGLAFGLLCVTCVLNALRREGNGWWVGAGFACGLTLFAKPEAGFATLATLITGIILGHAIGLKPLGRSISASLAGLVPAVSIVALAAFLAGGISALEHMDPYRSAVRALSMDMPFYDGRAFGRSLSDTLLSGGTLFLTIFAAALFAERRDLRSAALDEETLTGRWRTASMTLPVLAVSICAAVAPFAWHRLAAVLPWVCAAVLISSIRLVAATAGSIEDEELLSAAGAAILAVFATGWLLKIAAAPRFDHYGFALAAPSVLLGIGILNGDRPLLWRQRPCSVNRRRALGSALALYLAISSAAQSATFYSKRTIAVGAAANRMYLFEPAFDPRTDVFRELLRELAASSDFRQGAVILPEGGLFHFLLQQPSAVRVASLMPLEVLMMGSERAVELISRASPALVVVANPGLGEWSSSGDSALRQYMELIHAVESNCLLYRDSGERAAGMDRIHVRFLSPCPGFASMTSLDAPFVDTSPSPGSGVP